MEWQQEQRFDYVAQYVPNISEPNEKQRKLPDPTPTAAQLELFAINPHDYDLVEQWLSKLPRQQQREHFRKIYIREYKSVKDDGSIAFKFGNKQRKHANEAIREILLNRLDLVMQRYDFDVLWVDMLEVGLSRREEELTESDELTDAQREQLSEQQKAQIKRDNTIRRIKNRITAEKSKFKTLEKAKLPFFMLSPGRVEEVAETLSKLISNYQYDFILQFVDQKHELSAAGKDAIFVELYQKLGDLLEHLGFPIRYWQQFNDVDSKPLSNQQVDKALAEIARKKYWLKRMQQTQKRQVEHIAIACGEVQKRVAPYISNSAFYQHAQQVKKNYDFLKQMVLENIDDPTEQVDLLDMYLRSSANPSIRRLEMMTRLRGIEEWAESENAVGLFITLTAPSAYHAQHQNGAQNKKWNGASPRETHQYLNAVWQRYRALLAKRDIKFYGVRIAEPHHDATPHWHLLLFVHADHKAAVIELFRQKALDQDGDEQGAKEHRLKVDEIDKEKGAAAGYLGKYLAKNIDGFAQNGEMSDEVENLSLKDNAKRVRAWASLWGFRQFQFYGASSIGVWRELRRLTRALENNKLEELRLCADIGDQAAFLQRQGGAGAKRKEWAAVLKYEESEPNADGQTYKKVVGVMENQKNNPNPEIIKTRTKKWAIKKKSQSEDVATTADRESAQIGGQARPWTCVNNCNHKNSINFRQILKSELEKILQHVTERHIDYLLNDNRLWIDRFKYIEVRNGRLLMNDRSNLLQKHSGLSRLRSH